MKFLGAVALMAVSASAMEMVLYQDSACTQPLIPTRLYNGACTVVGSTGGGFGFKTTCSTNTAATVQMYLNQNPSLPASCTGTQFYNGPVNTTCLQVQAASGSSGAVYAMLVSTGTATCGLPAAGTVYQVAVYSGNDCVANNLNFYNTLVGGSCSSITYNGTAFVSTMVTPTGSSVSFGIYNGGTCSGSGVATLSNVPANGITCTNIAGLGQSIKVYNTSGAAAVVASVGAVLLALVVMFASL